MNTAYLCLGGNMGNREKNLEEALSLIESRGGQIGPCSAVFESEAWGADNQPAYLNCCVRLNTALPAQQLMSELLAIEQLLGRQRTAGQYASRTMDIDILFFNTEVIQSPSLTVPHPRLHLRRFVLVPLSGIAPLLVHPVLQQSVEALLRACPDQSIITLYKQNPCTSA